MYFWGYSYDSVPLCNFNPPQWNPHIYWSSFMRIQAAFMLMSFFPQPINDFIICFGDLFVAIKNVGLLAYNVAMAAICSDTMRHGAYRIGTTSNLSNNSAPLFPIIFCAIFNCIPINKHGRKAKKRLVANLASCFPMIINWVTHRMNTMGLCVLYCVLKNY